MKPICYDLYCGLGGWTEAFLAEGYECIGFDIEAHDYGTGGYPGKLILRDVRSIHGSELADATIIVGSSPCQEFSYRAMPWKRAKALPPPYLGMELFNAQFRIQREASEAAGRHIPMIVENVVGAQRWVGKAAWHVGSFYLWGDIPALMPVMLPRKAPGQNWNAFKETGKVSAHWRMQGLKPPSVRPWGDGIKQPGISGTRNNGKGDRWFQDGAAQHGSKSPQRKAASAMIAKIPYPLAQHIARTFKPEMKATA
jgi:hypothetical protein